VPTARTILLMFFRLLILLAVFALALMLNLCMGDVCMGPAEALQSLQTSGSQLHDMLWQIRLPRLLIAAVVGIGLATSGFVLQALTRNCLADPYLTGISSGAGLAASIAMIAGVDFSLIPFIAFAGGAGTSLVVALMAKNPAGLSVTKLLLAGVAVSAICGSFITLVMVGLASAAQSQGIFFWLAGGISGRTWSELAIAGIYIFVGLMVALVMSKSMRLLSLGAQSAQSLGVNVAVVQWVLLAAAVLTCGASVAISGLVGFVGLIAPQIGRSLFGRDERVQIICTAIVGGILVLLSDLAARTLGQGQELPLGTLLALVGGPFFLWLVSRQKGEGL